jgi:multidrug resistance efflux pump
MRNKILAAAGALFAVIVLVAAFLGYRYYDQSTNFVSTDDAQVSGDVVQVAPLSGGRVAAVNVDVGDVVKQGQTVATIDVAVGGAPGAAGASSTGALATTELVSPLSGVVIARRTTAGSVVPALQPVVSVVDLGKLWVTANVDESKISRVKIGQPADVHVDTLDKTFSGHVAAIVPASAATFSNAPAPASNSTGDFTKVVQLVPVRISVDYAGSMLLPGTSAEVDIRVS